MVTARFRFYGELNDFLARERRGHAFDAPCARAATVKHMVEALGVPHTEVAKVLVNDVDADLGQLLHDGDRVAIYPPFQTFPVSALADTADRSLERMRFIADAHLGGLARLLRMAGFDALYDNNYHDSEIEAIAGEEDRIVLTRDRELLKRRTIVRGCYVRALKPEQQLQEIVQRLNLAPLFRPFSLCLHCNAPLHPIDKAVVLDRIPPKTREVYTRFSTCDLCQRIFWEGSHWQRMRALLDKALQPSHTKAPY